MMRMAFVTGVLLLAAFPSSAEKWAISESWGKAGVSFDDYRADAVACGRLGANQDVSHTDAAKSFVEASRRLDTMTQGSWQPNPQSPNLQAELIQYADQMDQVVQGIRPNLRMREVRNLLQNTVDDCLRGKGYVRFRLTDEQRRHLAKMKIGSPDRHRYLYQLASDARVLTDQAEPDHPPPAPIDEPLGR